MAARTEQVCEGLTCDSEHRTLALLTEAALAAAPVTWASRTRWSKVCSLGTVSAPIVTRAGVFSSLGGLAGGTWAGSA